MDAGRSVVRQGAEDTACVGDEKLWIHARCQTRREYPWVFCLGVHRLGRLQQSQTSLGPVEFLRPLDEPSVNQAVVELIPQIFNLCQVLLSDCLAERLLKEMADNLTCTERKFLRQKEK